MTRYRLFLAVIAFFFLTPILRTEEPLTLSQAWVVRSNHYVIDLVNHVDTQTWGNGTFDLPPEVISWYGMTVTDGNELWAVIAMEMSEGPFFELKKYDTDEFKELLRKNIAFASNFDQKPIKLIKRDFLLYAVSEDFSEQRLDELAPKKTWQMLQTKCDFGILDNHADNKLLPILPPERDDEGSFVKMVRKTRGEQTSDYQNDMDSLLFGLRWNGWEFEAFIENKYLENTKAAHSNVTWESCKESFGVGGFFDMNHNSVFNAVKRSIISHESDSHNEDCLAITGGVTLIPPEQQNGEDEGKHYRLSLHFGLYSNDNETIAKIKEHSFYWEAGNFLLGVPETTERAC